LFESTVAAAGAVAAVRLLFAVEGVESAVLAAARRPPREQHAAAGPHPA